MVWARKWWEGARRRGPGAGLALVLVGCTPTGEEAPANARPLPELPRAAPPHASVPSEPSPPPARAPAPLPSTGSGELQGVPFYVDVTGGAEATASLPLAVVLHGLGDRPRRFQPFATCSLPLRVVRPQGPKRFGDGYSWFDLHARPGEPLAAEALIREAARLARFIEELAARYPTSGKPLVTGFSQGGMLSFALALRHPRTIGAAYPLAGWLPPSMYPSTAPRPSVPIHAQHGGADRILPHLPTMQAVKAIRDVGVAVELEVHPGTRHTVTRRMREQLCASVKATLASSTDDGRPSR